MDINGTHPVTGRALRPNEHELPDLIGQVIRAVDDDRGRLVLVYNDGRLMVREKQGSENVWLEYKPQAVSVQ